MVFTNPARWIALLLALMALGGCYFTHVPIITKENAHPLPLLADGEYCELTFTAERRPVMGEGQCLTLTWVEAERGYRFSHRFLGDATDDVIIRTARLSRGEDALARSAFYMAQADWPLPRTPLGDGAAAPARSGLMAVLARDDMLLVIDPKLPLDQVTARAESQGVRIGAQDGRPAITSLTAFPADPATIAGAWLGRELTHEIHRAEFPGPQARANAIRILVERQAADRDSPRALAERARIMLDQAVFHAGVLNHSLGLGLPPARIDPDSVTGLATLAGPAQRLAARPPASRNPPAAQTAPEAAVPAKPAAPRPPASNAPSEAARALAAAMAQPSYEAYQRCMGLLYSVDDNLADSSRMFSAVAVDLSAAELPRQAQIVARAASDLDSMRDELSKLADIWHDMAATFEAMGVDTYQGQRARLASYAPRPDNDLFAENGVAQRFRALLAQRNDVHACFDEFGETSVPLLTDTP